MAKPRVSVAEYIEQQIALSDKTQAAIAKEAGFDQPNVLTMIKQGKTKLPIARVGPLAKAISVDPVHLLRLCLSEYLPDTYEAIEPLFGRSLVSEAELEIVKVMRKAAGVVPLGELSDEHAFELEEVVARIAAEELQDRKAAVKAVNRKRRPAK